MTPIEIAKYALKEIMRSPDLQARMVALDALTEIAIIEQEAPKPRPLAPIIKRLFGGSHGS